MTDSQVALKLASLLRAGVSVNKARKILAFEVSEMTASNRDQLLELLDLIETHGSQATDLFEALAERIEHQTRFETQIEIAASAPRATARLVAFLPISCLGLAEILGIKVFEALAAAHLAQASLGFGMALLWLNRRLIKRSTNRANLVVSSELSRLRETSRAVLKLRAGASASSVIRDQQFSEAQSLFELAQSHGVELLPLLTAQARHLEMVSRFKIEKHLATLDLKLLMPVGLLVLPALVFIAVIPTAIALFAHQ